VTAVFSCFEPALEVPARLVKQVYTRFRTLCRQHHHDPCSYVYFYSNLSQISSQARCTPKTSKGLKELTGHIVGLR